MLIFNSMMFECNLWIFQNNWVAIAIPVSANAKKKPFDKKCLDCISS